MKTQIKIFALSSFALCSLQAAAQSADSTAVGQYIVHNEILYMPNSGETAQSPQGEPEQVHNEILYMPADGSDPSPDQDGQANEDVHHEIYYQSNSTDGSCPATRATFNYKDCRGYTSQVVRDINQANNGEYGFYQNFGCSSYIDEGEQSFFCNSGTWEKTDYIYCKAPTENCR